MMKFYVQTSLYGFRCHIDGTGSIKVHKHDGSTMILSLPTKLDIHTNFLDDIHDISIENIDAEKITIGPVTRGEIITISSWGDLDIIYLKNLFSTNICVQLLFLIIFQNL